MDFQKAKQIQERALAEYRQQERGEREVWFLEQRRQRRAPPCARDAWRLTTQARTPREDLDVARLVRCLDGQHLQHFSKVRVDAAEEARGHDQRHLLVLDQIRHDLHHGRLDVGWQRELRVPVDR